MRAEILAPAGGYEALEAAVRCGADAVYFGGKTLNARRGADNFDDDELEVAVAYCHTRGVKAYLTLNTLVGDEEFSQAIQFAERACAIGADALILQDIGLAHVLRAAAPTMTLHASTQMSVQTAAGLRMLRELGFSRAVLPRELSGEEIAALAVDAPLELEMFVHGALCMSVSGQCYMSAMLGSRSGNRGLCAGPCRLPFSNAIDQTHALSLKDLSLIKQMQAPQLRGIRSFKIEGRMKRPEYVAAAVTACRAALDGTLTEDVLEDLRRVFSRAGFTDGYYTGQRGRDMFGVRGRDDVVAASGVLSSLARLYEKEVPHHTVSFVFEAMPQKPLSLSASACGERVTVVSQTVPVRAQTRELTAQEVETQLKKCGGTPFIAGDTDIRIHPQLHVPMAAINALRRDALKDLEQRLSQPKQIAFSAPQMKAGEHKAPPQREVYARFSSVRQVPRDLRNIAQAEVPLDTPPESLAALAARVKTAVEIPRGLFGAEDKVRRLLLTAREAGITTAVAGTLDGLRLALDIGFETHAGFGTNAFNTQTMEAFEAMGVQSALLSAELTLGRAAFIGGTLPRGLIVYGRLPLMLTRCCPVAAGGSCAGCGGTSALTDRLGTVFPVTCSFGCSEVLNSVPIYMADRLKEIKNMDYITLYFTTESRDECREVLSLYDHAQPPPAPFTRGLYYRGVE